MTSDTKFGMLRKMLRAIGLSQQAADDVVNFIVDLLAGERKDSESKDNPEFPYLLRDDFLSPAELSFYLVLKSAVGEQVTICTKVGLSDIFYVKKSDASRHRIYTNKIDRKHVDFLLCDAQTMRPLVGIELDDRSHQRADRQERDAFVDGVFKAAKLPLLHVPVKRGYVVSDLAALLAPHLNLAPQPAETPVQTPQPSASPTCPKCGSEMLLRTSKKGANAGQQFWGCSNYPACRSMVPI